MGKKGLDRSRARSKVVPLQHSNALGSSTSAAGWCWDSRHTRHSNGHRGRVAGHCLRLPASVLPSLTDKPAAETLICAHAPN